ncbi:hypothetical protein GCM10007423_39630 [Dyadobacter endophyticus]|uniref:Uncharacterized protein n=1 Tax=Dyadobacter endophyticus TaxID=1749036 RepID=A0ABQ1Z0D1_9BACT|nr:hypothetical protein [Dyadobacter endophyticus]GGH42767.1 hypothetical protein GCM10007423_39630 [Dyadobacter endophyticus]
MNFKTIYIGQYNATVCLRRWRNDLMEEYVHINAFVEDEDNEYLFEDQILFPSAELARSFVQDFSDESAFDWLEGKADIEGIEKEP